MKALLIASLCFFLVSCDSANRFRYGREVEEVGEVYDTAFVPEGRGREEYTTGHWEKGQWKTERHKRDVTFPAKYGIMFSVDGSKRSEVVARETYNRLDRGMKVRLIYREVFEVTQKDGKDSEAMVDRQFLDAVRIPPPNTPIEQ